MSAGAFSKIATAQATGGGNMIRDGIYELMVEKVFMQSGHSGECFIAEYRVLKSAPNGALDERGNPVVPNPVGSSCSMVCNITKNESAAGNAKAFVEGALGCLGVQTAAFTADKWNEILAWVTSEKNPLRGIKITDETVRKINKGTKNAANAGKPITVNIWKPIAQTQEEVLKQRAWLETTPVAAQAAPAAPAPTPAPVAPAPVPTQNPLGGILPGFLEGK